VVCALACCAVAELGRLESWPSLPADSPDPQYSVLMNTCLGSAIDILDVVCILRRKLIQFVQPVFNRRHWRLTHFLRAIDHLAQSPRLT